MNNNDYYQNAINTHEFEVLPPNEEHERFGLIEMEGEDRLGHRHVYYVYEDPDTQDLIMSIGDPRFLEDRFGDRANIRASIQYFKDQQYILELRNQNRKRYLTSLQSQEEVDPVEEFPDRPDPKKILLRIIEENLKIKISKRKEFVNRLELYKLIDQLNAQYTLLKDECKSTDLMMLLMKLQTLAKSLMPNDLAAQEAEKQRLLQILDDKQRRRSRQAAGEPPSTPQREPGVLVGETPPTRTVLVPDTPPPRTVLVPATPGSSDPDEPNARRRNLGSESVAAYQSGGSRRIKSIRKKKNKKTLKSSNKLKKNNKNNNTKKIKSRK